MRVKKIQIRYFRGIKEADIDFDDQFTLLVGANGSGKTSVLRSINLALDVINETPPLHLNGSHSEVTQSEIYEDREFQHNIPRRLRDELNITILCQTLHNTSSWSSKLSSSHDDHEDVLCNV